MNTFLCKPTSSAISYFKQNPDDFSAFCSSLRQATTHLPANASPVFLCIGTDRMTGDCLGPLVGHKLKKHYGSALQIYGTLAHPIHALNLEVAIKRIRLGHTNPFYIVIDASLGLPANVGSVTFSAAPLLPGEGMGKKLSPVGDLSITGIVNSCHGNAAALLQNTRLHFVNELADFIYFAILNCFPK